PDGLAKHAVRLKPCASKLRLRTRAALRQWSRRGHVNEERRAAGGAAILRILVGRHDAANALLAAPRTRFRMRCLRLCVVDGSRGGGPMAEDLHRSSVSRRAAA